MMRKKIALLFSFLIVLPLVLVACGRGEDTEPTPLPTVVPTASIPEAEPTPTPQPSIENLTPPEGETAVTALDPDLIDWPPQLVYSSPAPGEEALLDGAITIRFDQPMEQDTVEAAFGIEAEDGSGAVDGSFTWPREDTVIFTPNQLQRQQSYKVRIADTAVSANGLPLELPVELQLQTVGFLDVSQVIPADGTQDVLPDTAITVLFNRPVVPLVAASQQSDLPDPLQFSPSVSGDGEWVSTSIYRFTPDTTLAGATVYQVQIDPELTDITGAVLPQGFNWQFGTVQPEVVSIEPEDNAQSVPLDGELTITFNMPMDRDSVERAVTIQNFGEDPTPEFEYGWSDGDRVLTLKPRELMALQTNHQLTISTGARAANGGSSLATAVSSRFDTVVAPAVVDTIPRNGELADRWQRGFSIRFASPMDADDLESKIRIFPEPEGTVRYFYNEYSNELSADFTMELNTRYTISVLKNAADPYGNWIDEVYLFSFTTPGRQPIASFNLPGGISQLSTAVESQVELIHVNISSVNIELYDVGLPVGLLTRPYDLQEYRPAASPLRTWSGSIETEKDVVELLPLSLADGGVLPTGVYLLTAQAPETTEEVRYWQNQHQLLVVADTNIVVKEMFGEVHVWVTDLASGQPAAGRDLTLYDDQGVPVGKAVSDNNGFATFPHDSLNDYLAGVTVVSNSAGQAGFGIGSSVWNTGVTPWQFGIPASSGQASDNFAYIYTDRPIYRPGDTVYFKGIVRDDNYGRYALPEVNTLELNLYLASFFGEEGLNETLKVDVDIDGSFSGEFEMPETAALGRYEMTIPGFSYEVTRGFSVAEYRRPEFLVSLTPDAVDALRGDAVDVVLEAAYFFGGPAADLPVNWTIYEEPFRLDVPGPYLEFGDGGDFFYQDVGPFRGGGGGLGNYLLNGEGVTDENGNLTIQLPADLLEDTEAGSRVINIEANVSDLSNFPVSSRTSLTLHAAETYVGISLNNRIVRAGDEVAVELTTVDWAGEIEPGRNVDVTFYRRVWEPVRTTDFGLYYTRWEAVDTEVANTRVRTGIDGMGAASFIPEEGGTYLVVAEVTDAGGRKNLSSSLMWVTDSRFVNWRLDPRERRMDLTPDAQEYRPGDTAQILVQSPFTEPVNAWLTIERGDLIEQRVITLNGSSELLSVPIDPLYAPNVFVAVTAIKGVTPDSETNRFADIRLGITELVVSPEQLELNVVLTPQNEQMLPGETAVYDIQVTDFFGNPVQADISLALVDLAVLTLKEDNAPPILEAFYAKQPYRSQVGSGLFISGEGLEAEIPLEGGGLGGGGGDFAAETALARAAGDEEEDDVRRDFPDTAFWEASLITDGNGRATVDIPLPDTLTTWRLSSKAVTEDTLVGQNSVDIVSSLPLLIRPVTPRFMTVGDELQIGAIVNNNTDADIEALVQLESSGVNPTTHNGYRVDVPANGQVMVNWDVSVPDTEFVDLTFRVEGGGFSDATKPSFGVGPDNMIPVYRYSAEDIVATSGVLDEAGRRVEAILLPEGVDSNQGSVDVQLSPSLAAGLLDALTETNEREINPSCAYAIADYLISNAVMAQAISALELDEPELLKTLNDRVETAVPQLLALQKQDGGWGWCFSETSQPFLTTHVLYALLQADAAGYGVDQAAIGRAGGFLFSQLEAPENVRENWAVNRQVFMLYLLSITGQIEPGVLAAYYDVHRVTLDPYAKALLAMALDNVGGSPEMIQTLLADMNDAANLSATGAHWQDANRDFANLSSDIRGTAIVINALTRLDTENELLPQAVRWLMVARQGRAWATTHETAWSMQALAMWMVNSGELDATYDYGLNVNLQQVAGGTFSRDNIADTEEVSIPVSGLVLDDVNFVDVQRGDGNGRLYYSMVLDSYIDASQVTAVSRGISVQRSYYDADCDPERDECEPIDNIRAGEQVRVELSITVPNNLLYAVIEDPIPAGAEAVDPGLETSSAALAPGTQRTDVDYRYGYWGWWYFNRIEFRDDRVVFLSEFLPAGTYQYTYFLNTTIPGTYQVRPTFAKEEFFPEVNGRSDGMLFTVVE